jgi:hypothetical protein
MKISPDTHTLIDMFPAYSTYLPKKEAHIAAGEKLAIYMTMTGSPRLAEAGSVVSYALSCNADPIEWLDRARNRTEELHWLNLCATTLHNGPHGHDVYQAIMVGDVVNFEGRKFVVKPAANRNFKLEEVK